MDSNLIVDYLLCFFLHIDYGIIIPPTCESNGNIVEFTFIEKDGFYIQEQRNNESSMHNQNERFIENLGIKRKQSDPMTGMQQGTRSLM